MLDKVKQKMNDGVEAYKTELQSLRTGRAHSGLVDKVMVDYYGAMTPIKQMANISVSDAQTLMITPWDKNSIPLIAKAIQVSDLGLTAVLAGDGVRVPIPVLTEERRKDLVKHLKAEAEKAKVGVRNIRRSELSDVKDQLKEKLITEDDERKIANDVQKITDEIIAQIDKITADKEKELMTI